MTNTIKKIAYLRGLCEGLGIAEESKEGVILKGILDVLDDMADDMAMFAEILDEEIDDEFDDELDDDFDDENEAVKKQNTATHLSALTAVRSLRLTKMFSKTKQSLHVLPAEIKFL